MELKREAFKYAEKYYKDNQKKHNINDEMILMIVQQRMEEAGYGYMWKLLEEKKYKEYEVSMQLIPE